MSFVFFLKKAWAVVKKYWWVFLAVGGFVAYRLLTRRDDTDIAQTLRAIQARHEEEIRAIRAADEERVKKYRENEERLASRLQEIERQHADAQRELDSKKKGEFEKILRESGDDPEKLAQKISDAAGFKVILP